MNLIERYQRLNEGQRKLAIFVAVIVVAIVFLMFPSISSLRPQTAPSQRAPRMKVAPVRSSVPRNLATANPGTPAQSPTPLTPLPQQDLATPPAPLAQQPQLPVAASPAAGSLIGIWKGTEASPDAGDICNLKLELKSQEPDRYIAYSTLSCMSVAPILSAKDHRNVASAIAAMNRNTPTAGILSGTVDPSGVLSLHLDKLIGPSRGQGGCTAFVITPFSSQLVAEWRGSSSCVGGQVMLHKSGS